MRTICLYFQVHQPYRLAKRYRFFEIGENHYYYDDYENRMHMQRIAKDAYLPANKLMLDLIKQHGDAFRISYSISGTAIEQFRQYAPEVLESFKELARTGNVEFLAETYSHSLSSLRDKDEFKAQVKQHADLMQEVFGQTPKAFRNTELIYDDYIGEAVYDLGYKTVITEGAKHVLGWKSPNRLYFNPFQPEQKILLRNYELSDDIAFRFSNRTWGEWPLTTEKYAKWLNNVDVNDNTVNLFMDYETFGEHQKASTGIFEFLANLPKAVLENTDFRFATASETANAHYPVAPMHVPYAISWADLERDVTAWLGNEMQEEAFGKLKSLSQKVRAVSDFGIHRDWQYLQTSDHFYYMSTKIMSDGMVHSYFNPYSSPFHAFINYMNILSDFALRVEDAYEHYLNNTQPGIENLIKEYEEKLNSLKNKLGVAIPIEKSKPEIPVISATKEEFPAIEEKSKAKPNAPTKPKVEPAKVETKATTKKSGSEEKKVDSAKKSEKKK
jgi:alpha-amylase